MCSPCGRVSDSESRECGRLVEECQTESRECGRLVEECQTESRECVRLVEECQTLNQGSVVALWKSVRL